MDMTQRPLSGFSSKEWDGDGNLISTESYTFDGFRPFALCERVDADGTSYSIVTINLETVEVVSSPDEAREWIVKLHSF